MSVTVGQMLHGYADGHRLLAATLDLPPAYGRRLLIHSDAAPGPGESRSLASLPLPELGLWTLTATWAAHDMPRPGSVWSHTLVLDAEALAAMSSPSSLLGALQRPTVDGDMTFYRKPILLEDNGGNGTDGVPDSLLRAVLLAFYGWPDEPVGVIADEISSAERALLAVWIQQWPELRARASFSTRRRFGSGSESRVQVALDHMRPPPDLMVLTTEDTAVGRAPSWVDALVEDLHKPGEVRRFILSYGPDAPRGYADVPSLLRIRGSLTGDSVDSIRPLLNTYPRREELARLKHDVFVLDGKAWPRATEAVRLIGVLKSCDSVAWEDLSIPERVAKLAEREPNELSQTLLILWREAPEVLRTATLERIEIAGVINARLITRVASEEPALAAELVSRAPRALHDAELWEQPRSSSRRLLKAIASLATFRNDSGLARALSRTKQDDLIRLAIQLNLVSVSSVSAAVAGRDASVATLDRYKNVFGDNLDAAVREALRADAKWTERMIAATSGSRGSSTIVDAAAEEIAQHLHQADEQVRLRAAVELLAALSRGLRHPSVVSKAFATVHSALVRDALPAAMWRKIEPVLPPGSDWDRAERLRALLVSIIESDRWSSRQVGAALRDAGPEAHRIRDLTEENSGVRGVIDDALGVNDG